VQRGRGLDRGVGKTRTESPGSAVTLLQRRDKALAEARNRLWLETRQRLRDSLGDLLPGSRVVVFGSLTKCALFHEDSDVDLALFAEPANRSIFGLMGELEERLHRPVDVVLLDQCRFRDKILKEGELWTNLG